MREILFRGKTKGGEWIEGNFIDWGNHVQVYIFPLLNYATSYDLGTSIRMGAKAVIPETVGQFTGLTDKKGKKIFEGDIVKYTRRNMYAPETSFHKQDIVSIHKIYWDNSNFRFSQEHYDLESKRCIGGGNITFTDWRAKEEEIEVIGNIHDNPELLEVD